MRRIAKKVVNAYYRTLGYYPTKNNGIEFKCDPYHVDFWKAVSKGKWEPHTYKIIAAFVGANSVYCDVGAWIGPTVIYAAKLCKQVICFEPDPVAYRYLRWNIELNNLHNVNCFNIALAANPGIVKIASFGGRLGDSMTSLLNNDPKEEGASAVTMTWQESMTIEGMERMDFLEIDIEGGEFTLLPTLKDFFSTYRPTVYLSTHAPYLAADLRKEKMQLIFDTMEAYGKCLDENLVPIAIHRLSQEDMINNFCSFVFTD